MIENESPNTTDLWDGTPMEPSPSAEVLLISDIKAIFALRGVGRLSSDALLEALRTMPNRPWRQEKPISTIWLADVLKRFGIKPRQLWISGQNARGYTANSFADTSQLMATLEANAAVGPSVPRPLKHRLVKSTNEGGNKTVEEDLNTYTPSDAEQAEFLAARQARRFALWAPGQGVSGSSVRRAEFDTLEEAQAELARDEVAPGMQIAEIDGFGRPVRFLETKQAERERPVEEAAHEPRVFRLCAAGSPVTGPSYETVDEAVAVNQSKYNGTLDVASFDSLGRRVRYFSKNELLDMALAKWGGE